VRREKEKERVKVPLTGGPCLANSNEFKNPNSQNSIQTWFAPKVTFPGSKILNKKMGDRF
jgi:hypothetical protein